MTTTKHSKKIDSASRKMIEIRMRDLGIGVLDLAQAIGISHVYMVYTIDGERKARWVRDAIGLLLGVAPHILFPDYESDSITPKAG